MTGRTPLFAQSGRPSEYRLSEHWIGAASVTALHFVQFPSAGVPRATTGGEHFAPHLRACGRRWAGRFAGPSGSHLARFLRGPVRAPSRLLNRLRPDQATITNVSPIPQTPPGELVHHRPSICQARRVRPRPPPSARPHRRPRRITHRRSRSRPRVSESSRNSPRKNSSPILSATSLARGSTRQAIWFAIGPMVIWSFSAGSIARSRFAAFASS